MSEATERYNDYVNPLTERYASTEMRLALLAAV